MARGGHGRSGPSKDPNCGRSERRGIKFTALPATPYDGEVPEFGLPDATDRELELWAEVWTWPEAWAWSQPSERSRLRHLRMYVRWSVVAEDREVNAATLGQIHRFADQAAVTQAGKREAGWIIAADEVGERRAEAESKPEPSPAEDELTARRKRAVGGGA